MRWMIASDLHGSAFYTDLLLRRREAEGDPRLILLGDILYHGPRNDLPRDYDTKSVAQMLNKLDPMPLCVRGNCDTEVDQMVLSFPVMAEYALLPLGDRTILLTHGHRRQEFAPLLRSGDLLFYGHTHVPDFTVDNGVRFVNPGSVSIPKEDSPHSYLMLEEDRLFWKKVETGEIFREERI